MSQFFQILVAGLISGSIYGIIALGFTLIYNVSGVVNLAQGDLYVVGALVTYGFLHWTSLGAPLSAVIAVAVTILVSLVLDRFVIRPARKAALAIILVLTVGFELLLQGVMLLIFGGDAQKLPSFGSQRIIHVGSVDLVPQDLWLFGLVAVVVVAMAWFLRRTTTGLAMRATSMSPFGAAVTGINAGAVRLVAFGISGALGAVAAIFASPLTLVTYDSGSDLGLKAFVAAVLGGLGNPIGAVAGGLGLGVAESLTGGYISSLYQDVIAFVILLVALLVRSYRHQEVAGPSFAVRATLSRIPDGAWRRWGWGGGVAVGVALPWLISNGYDQSLLILIVLYGVVLVGLDLLRGYAGMISLGHAAFMGIGAYSTALLTTRAGWSPLAALLIAIPMTAAVSGLFALVCARLSGYTLALATLGFAVIFEGLLTGLTSLTGGGSGVAGVAPFSIAGFSFSSERSQLYLGLAVFALVYAGCRSVVRRQPGRVMKAIHADELAARSLGIKASREKVKVFVVSAVIASIMGSLYANFEQFVQPAQFGLSTSLLLLTMLIIGGEGTLWGGVIGVVILKVIPQYFAVFNQYQLLIEGVLLIGVLLLLPSGAAGGATALANRVYERFGPRGDDRRQFPLREPLRAQLLETRELTEAEVK